MKRQWFTAAGALGLSAALIAGCSTETEDEVEAGNDNANDSENEASSDEESDQPKNVIMMIGDGMGMGQIEVTRLLEHGKEGILSMEEMPHSALMRTYSANNWVTDSAAAGTGIATSEKTDNGVLGMSPDGEELDSVLKLFQEHDRSVGVVSNNTVTDATPAAFTANVEDRGGQDEIARQMYEEEYDVMLGGGEDYWLPDEQDGDNLIEELEEKGYDTPTDRDELLDIDDPDQLLGLFHPSFMTYKNDYDLRDSNEPSLEEMTEVALESLSQDDNGFFAMIEGARIDHAAHAADIPGVWQETIEFDRTVADVREWASDRDDTLVVVLADHETMGVTASETMDKEALRNVEGSPEYYVEEKFDFDEDEGKFTTESVQSVMQEYAGVEMSDEDVADLNEYIYDEDGELKFPHEQGWEVGSFIADYHGAGIMSREVREGSSTGGHSADMVPVFAEGLGAENFDGTYDNTDIVQLIAELSGLGFEPGEIIEE
ncbi:alkaline phosphatase [Salisediminibacterium halotolerans]|uniref:Alkaline phosphatase n=1 Tax=Salisediminibacterium halotolerans TaxID=517425 RepID=A0A1H9U8P5_9BACI|nr:MULTISPECIES: alkaline phosphatase [Salisediminibacterium]RLJ75653.1 alkaline phosphatase [Actinophytocola xinjiangensis]RPE89507.1 alkaline phosphatase [Salisediminibacterium halotolerans]TWG36266.1 alkaline phosphatase [Salisediminibacterium halotolerans]SES05950.1 alkaline phosphatase [Salisediminibacterium haloalkalitolerans]GEL07388.1 alkaline phosphatase [Salisediminibacterium halotolerans]